MQAQCQCGGVSFTCPLSKPRAVYVCHCQECRRQSASAFGISAIFPRFDFVQHVRGSVTEYVRDTASGKTMRCYFCAGCGTRVIHARDGVDNMSVKGGCLEALSRDMVKTAIHIWTKEAVVDIPADCESWEAEPPDN